MFRKLLMTTDPVGGVWNYSLELCEFLASCGIEVLLVSMGGKVTPAQKNRATRIPTVQLQESEFRLEWMDEPWSDIDAASRWLLNLEQKFCPDLIHLNQFCFGSLPFQSPVLVVAHSCVCSWWSAVRGTPIPESWSHYRSAVQAGLEGADWVVAPSESMLVALQQIYGIRNRQTVIPNGRKGTVFLPAPKQEFIFSAGRVWDEAKNIRILMEVARTLPWPVAVAGESKGAPNARNVYFLGKLEDEEIRRWYARAAVYVAPALYEPFGLSVLEAALSECAPVLSNIPSFRENWFGTAFFVDPGDASSIRYGVQTMMKNPAFRWMIAKKARKRGLRYSSRRMAQSYVLIYNDLVTSGRKKNEYEELAEAQ